MVERPWQATFVQVTAVYRLLLGCMNYELYLCVLTLLSHAVCSCNIQFLLSRLTFRPGIYIHILMLVHVLVIHSVELYLCNCADTSYSFVT